jgi:3-dehydroquinate dehydratase-1
MGVLSRVAGEAFGSAMTFGTIGSTSAPGQIPVKELGDVLDVIHRSM